MVKTLRLDVWGKNLAPPTPSLVKSVPNGTRVDVCVCGGGLK